ncbi:helix-turn-helix transcriptional regulator [Flagellimonas beolgyonensis]|uniref:helix-turn-helix transcriptional regulator n=1 Tax=Flagellimonas beolgyonensis TaxID=864064 RepID=UPI003D6481CB
MNEEIVTRIQQVIDFYGLTVSAFADEIGVQRSSISHLLNGRNKPSLDFVLKLITAYPEVDLYWLLKGEGSFPPATIESKQNVDENTTKTIAPPIVPSETESITSKGIGSKTIKTKQIALFYTDGTFEVFNPKKD